jgi:hypothetical protein
MQNAKSKLSGKLLVSGLLASGMISSALMAGPVGADKKTTSKKMGHGKMIRGGMGTQILVGPIVSISGHSLTVRPQGKNRTPRTVNVGGSVPVLLGSMSKSLSSLKPGQTVTVMMRNNTVTRVLVHPANTKR